MRIDLNADLGESFGAWQMGDDEAMLEVVSSANIACGFHAGDPSVARATCAAAASRGVVIGAHVAYRDLAGFGRRFMDVAPAELTADVIYQLGALQAMAQVAGATIGYVKPHGALYNAIVHHEAQAAAVVRAIGEYNPQLVLLGLPGGVVTRLAQENGIRTAVEAFADRGYLPDGTLAPRSQPGAVLHDPRVVAQRMVRLVTEGTVASLDGTDLQVHADSLCIHGDSPGALAMATAVRQALTEAGVQIAPFLP
ncbi:LamB/YcsF family protein [Gephyromycinifex aptenodytis]|uniref:LamB/YcsF family protein n=1 Tax=Gephyromycinifex aptenodytis TaxID=2716227 RepID=UPI0014453019|nr:5-oxoprolinase subunit PxpA [Gephyromycinifex aptenodytis]